MTELGQIYYNPMLAQVCRDAVSRCPTCSARQSRRGMDIAQLPNFDEVTGPNGGYAQTWVLDCKGPLKAPNGHKRYILCAANVITRLVGFYLLKNLTAKEYAEVVFQQLICCYGSPVAL